MQSLRKIGIKILCTVFLLCFLIVEGKAQNDFFKFYDFGKGTFQQYSRLMPIEKNKLMLIGDFTLPLPGPAGFGLFVSKLDYQGNILQQDTLFFNPFQMIYNFTNYQNILKYDSNTFYITAMAAYLDSSRSYIDSADAFIAEYDIHTLKLLWLKKYKSNSQTHPYSSNRNIIKTTDGNLMTFGYLIDTINSSRDIAYLMKLDTAGNVLWKKTFSNPKNKYYLNPKTIHQMPNGQFLLGASLYSGTYSNPYYMITDSSGNLLWSKAYGAKSKNLSAACLPLKNGDILLAYSQGTYKYDFPNHFSYTHNWIRIMRLDKNRNIKWSRKIGMVVCCGLGLNIKKILPLSDGNFIIFNDYYNRIIKFNGQGDSLWSSDLLHPYQYYSFSAQQRVFDYIETSDHQLMFTGKMVPPPYLRQSLNFDIWVAKTDSLGRNMVPAPFDLSMNVDSNTNDSSKTIHLNWKDTAQNTNNRVFYIEGWYPPTQDSHSKSPGNMWAVVTFPNNQRHVAHTRKKHWSITVPKDTGLLKFQVFAFDSLRNTRSFPTNRLVLPPLGIKELHFSNIEVRLYPNPNKGSFTLKYKFKKAEDASLKIYDFLGKEVFKDHFSGKEGIKQYDLDQPAGSYLYRLTTKEGEMRTGKIVLIN